MTDSVSKVKFDVVVSEELAAIKIPNRLSIIEAVDFKETCQKILGNEVKPTKIILDFSQTTFIDSSGIGALVNNLKSTKEKGVELLLTGVREPVFAVFKMTSLEQVLNIEQCQEPIKTTPKRLENQLPTTHPSIRSWIKRLLDIVGSIIGLAITALVFIPIAIAIKLDDGGPIFFSQVRYGWMGKPFRIWKFRSMVVDAEKLLDATKNYADNSKIFKAQDDPRITKVGRFLRKSSLDELPQFWNVIKGEMSLVGTRPPLPKEVEIYEVPEWQRLDVKPGMTGEWQVNGRSTIKSFEDIIQLDLRYQKNWSLAHDLKLIIQTLLVVFKKEGAG